MAVTFTTWQALYLAMLDVAAEFYGGKMQVAAYSINTGASTRQFTYRTEKEFRDGLDYIKKQAQAEASGVSSTTFTPVFPRTYAKNGGRG